MKDKISGKSRGFGYITMKDSLMVDIILRSQPIFIEGKLVECKIAIPKDHIQDSFNHQKDLKLNSKANFPLADDVLNDKTVIYPKKIFVGGLPNDVTEREFFEYFAKYGHIIEFSIKHDNKTGNSRGFGFVIFKNVKSVENVLREKSSHCIKGKWIDCKPAFQKEFNQYLAQNDSADNGFSKSSKINKTNTSNELIERNFEKGLDITNNHNFPHLSKLSFYDKGVSNQNQYENNVINNFKNKICLKNNFKANYLDYPGKDANKFSPKIHDDSNINFPINTNNQTMEQIIKSNLSNCKKHGFSMQMNEEKNRGKNNIDKNEKFILPDKNDGNTKNNNLLMDYQNNDYIDEGDNFLKNNQTSKYYCEKNTKIFYEEVKLKTEDQDRNNPKNQEFYNISANHASNNPFPNLKDNFFESELVTAFFNTSKELKEENKRDKIKLFNEGNKENELEDNDLIVKKFEHLFNKRPKKKYNPNDKIDFNENESFYGPKINYKNKNSDETKFEPY